MRKLLLILVALSALVVAAPTLAAKIKSGTSTVTLSSGASQALTDNGITVTAIAPATAAGGVYTFPIARGRINKNGRGFLLHKGGLTLTKGEKSISFRHPLIVAGKKGGVLAVQTGRKCHRAGRGEHGEHGHHGRRHGRAVIVCRVTFRAVARLSDITREGNTGSATLKITKYAAHQLNKLAGTEFAHAGDLLGTVNVVVSNDPAPTPVAPPVTP